MSDSPNIIIFEPTPQSIGLAVNQPEQKRVAVTVSEPSSRVVNLSVSEPPPSTVQIEINSANKVLSVNGQAGVVVLGRADVGLGNVENISIISVSGLLQSEIDSVNSSGNLYYLKSNPSGFITGVDLSNYVTKLNAAFINRPTVNGTGVLLSGEAASLPITLVYTSGDQTINGIKNFIGTLHYNGNEVLTGNLGNYYLKNNPSGFITGVDLSSYLTTASASNTYYPRSNPSGFITGVNLSAYTLNANTGSFVTTAQTGAFASVASLSTTNSNVNSLSTALSTTNANLTTTGTNLLSSLSTITSNLALTGSNLASSLSTISSNLAFTGSSLTSSISNILSDSTYVKTTGIQIITGTKFFDNAHINNLYVDGAQTIVHTQTVNVDSNYINLNATGGARDAGLFINLLQTGTFTGGAYIGWDVPSNTWRMGSGLSGIDLSNLDYIASQAWVNSQSYATASNLAATGSTLTSSLSTVTSNLALTGSNLATSISTTSSAVTALSNSTNTRVTSLSTALSTTNSNLTATGSNLLSSLSTVTSNLALTGSNLATSLSTTNSNVTSLTTNLSTTGSNLLSSLSTVTSNLALTGSNLSSSLSTVTSNLALTGSTLNSNINSLSGSAILTYPLNQTISGNLNITGNLNVTGNVGIVGTVSAAAKSFLINHPLTQGKKLQYGSLESPYHGIRLTDRGKINSSVQDVLLPDYISSLITNDNINIQITNINHSKTLYVKNVDIPNNKFTVGCDRLFFDKNEYEFYWSFTAERKDIPKLIVEF